MISGKIPDPAGHSQANRSGLTPIAKINVVVPYYFPAHNETAPLSPKWTRFSRAQILQLKSLGLVQCVNATRKLWKCTHRANVRTADSRLRIGGLVSLAVERSVQELIAAEIA